MLIGVCCILFKLANRNVKNQSKQYTIGWFGETTMALLHEHNFCYVNVGESRDKLIPEATAPTAVPSVRPERVY